MASNQWQTPVKKRKQHEQLQSPLGMKSPLSEWAKHVSPLKPPKTSHVHFYADLQPFQSPPSLLFRHNEPPPLFKPLPSTTNTEHPTPTAGLDQAPRLGETPFRRSLLGAGGPEGSRAAPLEDLTQLPGPRVPAVVLVPPFRMPGDMVREPSLANGVEEAPAPHPAEDTMTDDEVDARRRAPLGLPSTTQASPQDDRRLSMARKKRATHLEEHAAGHEDLGAGAHPAPLAQELPHTPLGPKVASKATGGKVGAPRDLLAEDPWSDIKRYPMPTRVGFQSTAARRLSDIPITTPAVVPSQQTAPAPPSSLPAPAAPAPPPASKPSPSAPTPQGSGGKENACNPNSTAPNDGIKRCNCKKSRCLKLYCDCFAAGKFCSDCSCQNCANLESNEAVVNATREQIRARNPNAFLQKIAVAPGVGAVAEDLTLLDDQAFHIKGCHCKKSHCLKKYCECFNAGVRCGDHCKCEGCHNTGPPGPHGKAPPSAPAALPPSALPLIATRSTIATRAAASLDPAALPALPQVPLDPATLEFLKGAPPPLLAGKLPSPPPPGLQTAEGPALQVASGAGLLSPDFPAPAKSSRRLSRSQAAN